MLFLWPKDPRVLQLADLFLVNVTRAERAARTLTLALKALRTQRLALAITLIRYEMNDTKSAFAPEIIPKG
jgi:hypothetical protein